MPFRDQPVSGIADSTTVQRRTVVSIADYG